MISKVVMLIDEFSFGLKGLKWGEARESGGRAWGQARRGGFPGLIWRTHIANSAMGALGNRAIDFKKRDDLSYSNPSTAEG